ncbi:MAG: GNAT family N-acetyltransferase [FCB group bacterium]|nr:GNAT family N-acetyltransferase [FCB group bacterium]
MQVKVKPVENATEKAVALAIREEVFVREQNVPLEIEMDEFDKEASHVLAFRDEKPVGTARWRATYRGIKLERFAVLKPYRSKGVGKALVTFILDQIPENIHCYLHAQESVIPFYEQFGFRSEGPLFYEADIPHRRMVL